MSEELNYSDYISTKTQGERMDGFAPTFMPDYLFGFQKATVDWAIRKGRGAIFADCGLGKTIMELVWAINVCDKTGGRVLIITPIAVGHQVVSEADKFGISGVSRSRQGEVDSRITVTNYERLHYFNPSDFEGVVLDECFPPETPIEVFNLDKSLTSKYIKDIKVGDKIFNANGEDYVKQTYKRRINRAVQIGSGQKKITCSENHPFFTLHGWRCAQDLQPGDHVMETAAAVRLVREGIHPGVCSLQVAKILQSILLSEMENEPAGDQDQGTQSGSSGSAWFECQRVATERRPEGQETSQEIRFHSPNVEPGDEGEGVGYIAEDEAQTFRAWGEWDWFDGPAEDFIGCSWTKLDRGIFFVTGPTNSGLSRRLQARLGKSREENKHRSGRNEPLRKKEIGSEEGCKVGFSRVDSVEVLEQGHTELERYRDADGHVYFYDIKAAQHPSFSVNGLLVHNSSILKNFNGATKNKLNIFLRKIPYRLLATATAAPNDFTELGTSSEALGYLGYMDMLSRFFKNDQNNCATNRRGRFTEATKWRLKGHAHDPFWKWVTSWSRSIRKPSDCGFPDDGFALPPLIENEHELDIERPPNDGELFTFPANGLKEVRDERRATIKGRCEFVAELFNGYEGSAVAWCNLNDEGDLLEKMIPDSIQVSGNDTDDEKEAKLTAFTEGKERILITKAKIGAWGLNWQHCNKVAYLIAYSYEQYYQAIRRCWRFGQTKPVVADLIYTRGDRNSVYAIRRKQQQADEMFTKLVAEMNNSIAIEKDTHFDKDVEVPTWL